MPLADLLALIDALSARIDKDGETLRRYEALTRYALIDPLLRGLGWDTSDPAQVFPEYPLKKGFSVGGREFADYALLKDNSPIVILEAKKLDTPLRDEALGQAITYCVRNGIPYAAATNGQKWEIYETFRQVADDEKLVTRFDLKGSPAEVCLNALALWRPGVLEGQVRVAATPVLANTESASRVADPPGPPQPDPAEGEWLPLTSLAPEGGSKPAEVQFPTGKRVPATAWADFMAALVGWLEDEGHLSQADAPIQYGKLYILATNPAHPNGQPFSAKRQTRFFHINTSYSAHDTARNARLIIERAGLDPAQFRVRLRD